jgi:hypothetical protein
MIFICAYIFISYKLKFVKTFIYIWIITTLNELMYFYIFLIRMKQFLQIIFFWKFVSSNLSIQSNLCTTAILVPWDSKKNWPLFKGGRYLQLIPIKLWPIATSNSMEDRWNERNHKSLAKTADRTTTVWDDEKTFEAPFLLTWSISTDYSY